MTIGRSGQKSSGVSCLLNAKGAKKETGQGEYYKQPSTQKRPTHRETFEGVSQLSKIVRKNTHSEVYEVGPAR